MHDSRTDQNWNLDAGKNTVKNDQGIDAPPEVRDAITRAYNAALIEGAEDPIARAKELLSTDRRFALPSGSPVEPRPRNRAEKRADRKAAQKERAKKKIAGRF